MLKHPLFTPKFTTGQNVKIIKPSSSAMLDSCEANIGQLSGVARSISAILCDGSDEHDQWQLMNVIDSTGALLDHVAIKGAVSSEQAIRLCGKYLPELQTGSIRNVVPMTDSAIKTFLDGANIPSGTPFVLASDALELDSIGATKSVEWVDGCIRSHGGSISQLMLDMRRCDPQGQLLEHVTPRDIVRLVIDDSCEFGPMLDAMIIKHRNLEKTVTRMAEALKAYDNEEFFVKTVTPIEPFKRNGVANVGAIFEMSDSQKITVLFANPDSTPAKLSSDDVLTSWKWMLNKRDVTAILQPRAVDAKKYNVIAERMTRLLARNHKKFKDAQASRAKDELLLSELVGQVEADQLELRTLDAQYNAIQQEIDAEATRKLNQTEIGKAGESGLTAEGAEKFHTDLKATLENEQNVQMNKSENTAFYEIKNGRKKEGTIKVTKDGDSYTAFVAIAGVGGEFVGDLNQVKSWLAVRLQRLGESAEGASLSWESTASRLKLKSGEDYLNLSQEFVTFEEMAPIRNKLDLAFLIAKKLSKMDGWSMSGSTAFRDVTLNGQTYKYKFNFDPSALKKEFRIDEVLMAEPLDISTKKAVVTFGMFMPSREGVELAVKSLYEGVNSHIEKQLKNNTQGGEQDVQMNNDNSQNNNAVSDDQQFLERVVAGTEDMSSADFGDKLIAIAENLDPALEALFEQATDAYANYAISLEV